MIKYFKKVEKKMLAIFSVGLMIAFALPSYMGKGRTGRDVTIGRIGKTPVSAAEREQYRQEWNELMRIPVGDPQRPVPLAQAAFGQVLGQYVVARIQQKPETFMLLVKEAQRLGVQVSDERVGAILQNELNISPDTTDPQHHELIQQSVRDLVLVLGALNRATGAIKVSQPLVMHELATGRQAIKLNLIEYLARDYLGKVPQPTNDQLQKQFDEFKNTFAGQPDAQKDPFGFGYKLPDRLKLQYIQVPRDEVVKVVKAKKDDYQWDVDVYRYYQKHVSEFPTTQPDPLSTGVTLGPLPPMAVRPKTGSTTRPVQEVRGEIMDKLIKPDADRLADAIQDRINSVMASDYAAYRKGAGPAGGTSTRPTTLASAPASAAPASSLAVPYDDYEYLTRLAQKIQKDFGVLPSTHKIADAYKSEQELNQLPDIGKESAAGADFSTYVMQHVEPFAKPVEGEKALAALEPSPPLKDAAGNSYLFRVTDAKLAGPPASMADARDKVEQDWKMAQAYKLAREDAEKDKAMAEKDAATTRPGEVASTDESGLKRVAAAARRKVISVGPINGGTSQVPGYAIPEQASQTLVKQAVGLLTNAAASNNPHPIGLVELPAATRVLLDELDQVRPLWSNESVAMAKDALAGNIHDQMAMTLWFKWFDYNSVARRLDYKPEGGKSPGSDENTPPPPPFPLGS